MSVSFQLDCDILERIIYNKKYKSFLNNNNFISLRINDLSIDQIGYEFEKYVKASQDLFLMLNDLIQEMDEQRRVSLILIALALPNSTNSKIKGKK